MAKYGGSFTSGLAGGLQTGLNYGMQAAQVRWQVEQKKKLDKEKEKMQEVWTNFSQSAQEVYESGSMSQETERKLYSLLFTLPPELQASANNLLTSVNQNDKAGAEKEFNNLQMVMEVLESTGGRIDDASLDGLINLLSPENQKKVKAVSGAYKSVEEPEVTPYGFYGESPAGVQEQIAGSVAGQTPGLEGVEFKEEVPGAAQLPKVTDYNTAASYLSKFATTASPETFNAIKAGLQQNTGLDLSAITQQSLKEPEKVAGVTEPKPETVSTLKNWESMFDVNAEEGPRTEEDYNRALDLLAQSEDKYKPKHASWKEALVSEVKGIGKELEGITDKDDYNLLLNVYMQKLEEIKAKYPDVDLTQFKEFEENKNWFDKLKEKVGL